jgi:hypothetical protein
MVEIFYCVSRRRTVVSPLFIYLGGTGQKEKPWQTKIKTTSKAVLEVASRAVSQEAASPVEAKRAAARKAVAAVALVANSFSRQDLGGAELAQVS